MSSIEDVPASTVIGRSLDNRKEVTMIEMVARGMMDNIKEMIGTEDWWDKQIVR